MASCNSVSYLSLQTTTLLIGHDVAVAQLGELLTAKDFVSLMSSSRYWHRLWTDLEHTIWRSGVAHKYCALSTLSFSTIHRLLHILPLLHMSNTISRIRSPWWSESALVCLILALTEGLYSSTAETVLTTETRLFLRANQWIITHVRERYGTHACAGLIAIRQANVPVPPRLYPYLHCFVTSVGLDMLEQGIINIYTGLPQSQNGEVWHVDALSWIVGCRRRYRYLLYRCEPHRIESTTGWPWDRSRGGALNHDHHERAQRWLRSTPGHLAIASGWIDPMAATMGSIEGRSPYKHHWRHDAELRWLCTSGGRHAIAHGWISPHTSGLIGRNGRRWVTNMLRFLASPEGQKVVACGWVTNPATGPDRRWRYPGELRFLLTPSGKDAIERGLVVPALGLSTATGVTWNLQTLRYMMEEGYQAIDMGWIDPGQPTYDGRALRTIRGDPMPLSSLKSLLSKNGKRLHGLGIVDPTRSCAYEVGFPGPCAYNGKPWNKTALAWWVSDGATEAIEMGIVDPSVASMQGWPCRLHTGTPVYPWHILDRNKDRNCVVTEERNDE